MLAHGSDRLRITGRKALLFSTLPKGWTPRTPKTLTHSEHPGTAVEWDGEYYEVVAADALPSGAVRYVLEPWRDEHVMRTVSRYDDESEARLLEDHRRAERQRRSSVLARIGGVLTGHLPEPVQARLANDLGVSAPGMTLVSCIPPFVVLGVCVWLTVGARLRMESSPVPAWLWIVTGILVLESAIRFFVAMSQNRGMGTSLGLAAYIAYWSLSPKRAQLVSPFAPPGEGVYMIAPPQDVALRDSFEMRGPLLTFLTAEEQRKLVARYGFEYRRHAVPITTAFLICALLGVISMASKLSGGGGSFASVTSLVLAAAVSAEQIVRLVRIRSGPAGSIFAIFVRPFARDLLERE